MAIQAHLALTGRPPLRRFLKKCAAFVNLSMQNRAKGSFDSVSIYAAERKGRIMKELERLEKDLKESEELRKNWKATLAKVAESGAKSKNEMMAEAAQKLGYSLTVADIEKALVEAQPLSEESLAQVSGGMFWLGDDAPDGREKRCFEAYYLDYDKYGPYMPSDFE
jgi:hypothetical protein